MNLIPIILVFMFVFSFTTKGQEAMLYIDSVSQCSGAIYVPVKVQHGVDLAAISLSIKYDSTSMLFVDTVNTNALLQQGINLINAVPGEIYFSWLSVQGVSLTNSTLFELYFIASAGQYSIEFDTLPGQCELANTQNEVIPCALYNGILHYGPHTVKLTSPENTSVIDSDFVDFTWSETGCAIQYQLQVATDSLFEAMQLDVVLDSNASRLDDLMPSQKYYWRVRAIQDSLIGSWSTIYWLVTDNGVAVLSNKEQNSIEIYSKFSDGRFFYTNTMDEEADVQLIVYNALGQIAISAYFQMQKNIKYTQNANLPNGLYFVRSTIGVNNKQIRKVIKLIKNND